MRLKLFENVKKLFVILGLLTMSFAGCQHDIEVENNESETNKSDYVYSQPVNHGDGWETDSISNHSINADTMGTLMDRIKKGIYNDVNSVLIVKGGKLVFEEYFTGTNDKNETVEYNWNVLHHNASVTKSIVSGLIGIALDKGFIDNVNNLINQYFLEYTDIDWGNNKNQITIRNLLAMTSGLYYDESSTAIGSEGNSHYEMNHSQDPIKYVLEQEMITDPGLKWNYSSGNTVLLGRIIKRCTGIYIDKFAENNLFNELGVTDYHWNDYETGDIRAHGGLALRPRDMAKFGQLFLSKGVWKGKQVVSTNWTSEAVKNQIPVSEGGDYGYSWWLYRFQVGNSIIDSYAAVGWGGQYIFVLPSVDALIVFTNGNFYQQDYSFDMLQDYILPALF